MKPPDTDGPSVGEAPDPLPPPVEASGPGGGAPGASAAGPGGDTLDPAWERSDVLGGLGPVPATATRVGRHVILSELGRGGMGVVYRAWDPELDRTVALKMLLWGELAGEERQRRFLLEARAIARLSHPGIVRLYDSGVESGSPWYTMDYVAGPSLRDRLAEGGALEPREAAGLVADVARALDHAHSRGVIHRDVKPANILLEDGNRPRIGDFGVARLDRDEVSALTQAGQVVGTPAYMAPEQATGQMDRVDARADVYALGAVLFHAVAGVPPFDPDPMRVAERLHADPPTLRRPGLDLPEDLDLVCQKALAPRPEDRYQTAAALAEDTERFVRGEPVTASRPSLRRRVAWRLARHRHVLIGVGVTLVLGLSVSMGIWAKREWLAQAERERREAVAAERWRQLDQELEPLWAAGEVDRARTSLAAFLELPEVRGTHAATGALLDAGQRALAADDPDQALEDTSRAYVQAHQPDDQRASLEALAEVLWANGDRVRLVALEPLLARLPDADRRSSYPRRAAEVRRELDALAASMDGPEGPLLAPVVRAFSRWRPTGTRAQPVWWARRSGGFGNDVDVDLLRSVVLPVGLGAEGELRPASLVTVEAPPGRRFTTPVFEMGSLGGRPLLAAGLTGEGDVGRAPQLLVLEGATLRPVAGVEAMDLLLGGCHGDLDGDGREELYLRRSRELFTVLMGDEGPTRVIDGDPVFGHLRSELAGCFVADLDADGVNELVVGLDGWRAYEVRVFHASPVPGRFVTVARRKVGQMNDLAPYPMTDGRTGILVLRSRWEPDPLLFPPEAPGGLARGTWLMDLADGHLRLLSHLPPPARNVVPDHMSVGDFNADGRMDVAIQSVQTMEGGAVSSSALQKQEIPLTQVALAREDGTFVSFQLPGLTARAVLQGDEDPAAELLVEESATGAMWVLGAGDQPIPPVLVPSAHSSAPLGVAPNEAWARLDDLLSLGLTGAGAALFDQFAASTPAAQAGPMLLRLGELEQARGRIAEAAARFEQAAARMADPAPALRRAAAAWRSLWRFEAERLDIERLRAAPGLSEAERGALAARAEALASLSRRPLHRSTFDGPLDPAWQVDAPELVRQDRGQGRLLLSAVGVAYPLLHLPMSWTGGPLTVEIDLEIPRLEWASELGISLRPPEGGRALTLRLAAWGGGGVLHQYLASLSGDPKGITLWTRQISGATAARPLAIRLEIDPSTDSVAYEVSGMSGVFPPGVGPLSPDGRLDLAFLSMKPDVPAGVLERVALKEVRIWGAAPRPVEAGPLGRARRLLAEGRYTEVEAALAELPREDLDGARARVVLQCRRGYADACVEGILALHRPGYEAQAAGLRTAMLRDVPGLVIGGFLERRGRTALGWIWDVFSIPAYMHPNDDDINRVLAGALGALEHVRLPPPSTSAEALLELEVQARRAQALQRRGDVMRARVAHREVSRRAGDLGRWPLTEQERAAVQAILAGAELEVAMSYALTGELEETLNHLRLAMARSVSPELAADQAWARPEMRGMLRVEEVRALLDPPSWGLDPR